MLWKQLSYIIRIAVILALVTAALMWLLPITLNTALDFQATRNEIAHEVQKKLGRKIYLDGDIHFQLRTFTPGFRLTDVRLQNAAWGSRPDMLRLETLDVDLRLLPLIFHGELDFKNIELGGADIFLETDRQGRGNWEFHSSDNTAGKKDSDPASVHPAHSSGLHWLIEELRIRGSTLTYQSGETGRIREVFVEQANLSLDDSLIDGSIAARYGESDLSGDLRLQFTPRFISASVKSRLLDLDDLLETESRVRRDARVKRRVPQPAHEPLPFDDLLKIDAKMEWDVAELRKNRFRFQNLRLNGQLTDGRLELNPVQGKFAGGEFDAGLKTNATEKSIALRFHFSRLQLASILTGAKKQAVANAKMTAVVHLESSGANLSILRENLRGPILLETGPVEIFPEALYATVGSEAARALKTWVNPLPRIDCFVARFDFQNGRGAANVFVIDSNELAVASTGYADIAADRLHLVFQLLTKKLSVFSLADAVPIHLKGSFEHPTFHVTGEDIAKRVLLDVLELPALPVDIAEQLLARDSASTNDSICEGARRKAARGLELPGATSDK